jgi:hypothetical protein
MDAAVEHVRALSTVSDARRVSDGLEVRLTDGASAAPLVALLVERGAEIEEVRRERPSLEETFLELVTTEEGDARRTQ